jgi:hypothetical protein
MELPLTPYAGTSGWAGSVTSRQRAEQQDSDGTTGKRQGLTLELLDGSGARGMTWKELSADTGWHHGSASGVLSVLHKTGKISRLRESRDRCAIYVSNHHKYGRPTDPYKSNKSMFDINDLMRQVLKLLPDAVISEDLDGELVIHTRMRVISSDEQIAPIGEK